MADSNTPTTGSYMEARKADLVDWALGLLRAEGAPSLVDQVVSGMEAGDYVMHHTSVYYSELGLFHVGDTPGEDEPFIHFFYNDNDFNVSESWGGFDN